MNTYPLWQCCNEESKKVLASFMPKNWQPTIHYQADDTETIEDIDRIMQQVPKGDKAGVTI